MSVISKYLSTSNECVYMYDIPGSTRDINECELPENSERI